MKRLTINRATNGYTVEDWSVSPTRHTVANNNKELLDVVAAWTNNIEYDEGE